MDVEHLELLEGRAALPLLGAVQGRSSEALPYSVLGADGSEVDVISSYLRKLALMDMSPLTVRSYAHDLLRWWRLLHALKVDWDRATQLRSRCWSGGCAQPATRSGVPQQR